MNELEAAVQTERQRCADWCERAAVLKDEAAAKLRADGTWPAQTLHLTWPFVRKSSFVHPNWERAAAAKDEAASMLRVVKQSILEGWMPA